MNKKWMIAFLCLGMLLSMISGALGEMTPYDTDQLDALLSAVVNREDGCSLAGFSVLAIVDGEVVYTFADGNRYIDNECPENNRPFTVESKMRIASISKSFTAVGVMQLVESGVLDLDEDVSTYLGFTLRNPYDADTAITTRMLLSHTSGLRDGDTYSIAPAYSLKEFFLPDGLYYENGAHFAPAEEPVGSYFSYANLNFGVLGTLIECVSGERFDVYMTNHVLAPMGITASYNVSTLDAESLDNLAVIYRKDYGEDGYALDGSGWNAQIDDYSKTAIMENSTFVSNPDTEDGLENVSLADYVIGTNATHLSPQGGLRISVAELGTYIQMYLGNGTVNGHTILTPESVDLMFAPQWTYNGNEEEPNGDNEGGLFNCWGLGIQLVTSGKYSDGYGDTFLEDAELDFSGHYGDAYGAFSIFMVDRENQRGFAYACNGTECDYYAEPSWGNYSENWIWEEETVTALNDLIFNK